MRLIADAMPMRPSRALAARPRTAGRCRGARSGARRLGPVAVAAAESAGALEWVRDGVAEDRGARSRWARRSQPGGVAEDRGEAREDGGELSR